MIYTDYRPTPLQHYIFPAGGDGLRLVVDENVRNIHFERPFSSLISNELHLLQNLIGYAKDMCIYNVKFKWVTVISG